MQPLSALVARPRWTVAACALLVAIPVGFALPARAPLPQLAAALGLALAFAAHRRHLGPAAVTAPISLMVVALPARLPLALCAAFALALAVHDTLNQALRRPREPGLQDRRALPAPSIALGLAALQLTTAAGAWAGFRTASTLLLAAGFAGYLGTLLRIAIVRRFEVGLRPRLAFASALALAFVSAGLAYDLAQTVEPCIPWLGARAGFAAAAAALGWLLEGERDAEVESRARTTLVVSICALPLLAAGYAMVSLAPEHAALTTIVLAALLLLVGLGHTALQQPLLPWGGRLLAALALADAELATALDSDALRRALVRLREPYGAQGRPTLLYFFEPEVAHSADAAGYLHTREARVPRELLALCAEQRYGCIQTELLAQFEVRRPDVRPALTWLRQLSAQAATLVRAEGAPLAMLVVPRGLRREDLSACELSDLERLATKLAACKERALDLSRSHARQQQVAESAAREHDEKLAAAHVIERIGMRNLHATLGLAQQASLGVFTASARDTWDALVLRVHQGAPLVVLAQHGSQPVPWIAKAYAEGPKQHAPFVVVECTQSRYHDLALWTDAARSPLALADGGMLVLADARALPPEAQEMVAIALAERRPPWPSALTLELQIAVTVVAGAKSKQLPALGALLQSRLTEAVLQAIALPALRERADDLRRIVEDAFAREGLRLRGTPLGLAPFAAAKLVEHPFVHDEAELAYWITRLAEVATGPMVEVRDLVAAGFISAFELTPLPARAAPTPREVAALKSRVRKRQRSKLT